ncbi:MAG: oligosaccharide flippase family protein [Lachnospiraceae bacterium]|nr:oligosaccharide flippase family protein [Lachnospiraceae bacterium]
MNVKCRNLLNEYKKLPVQIKAALWFFICTVMQKGVTIISTPIFTRLLSTEEYGIYSVFNSWMGIIICFVTLNLYSGVYTQGLVKFDSCRNKFSAAMQGLMLSLVILWFALYIILKNRFNQLFSLTTWQMIAMFLIIWTNGVFGFWSNEQRFEYQYRKLVSVTLAESVLQPLLSILLMILFPMSKVSACIFGIAFAGVLCYGWLCVVQLKKGRCFFAGDIWKYALNFSIPLIPHYLSQIALNGADKIMIKEMVNETAAGIYSLAYTVSRLGTLFNNALLQTLTPWIYKKIKEEKFEDLAFIAYLALVFIGSVNLLTVLFAPEIIRIFAPEAYGDSVWLIPPVAMSVFFMFAYNLFAAFEFYYGKAKYISTATVIGAGLNIVLNYFFIKNFGYMAAGYTTLFCYMIFAYLHYRFMKKICRELMNNVLVYKPKILLSIVSVFLVAGFLLMFTYRFNGIRYSLIALFIVFAIIFRKKIAGIIEYMLRLRKY